MQFSNDSDGLGQTTPASAYRARIEGSTTDSYESLFLTFFGSDFFSLQHVGCEGARLSHERITARYTLYVVQGNAISVHSVGSGSLLYELVFRPLMALHFLFEGCHRCFSQSDCGVLQTGLEKELAEESV